MDHLDVKPNPHLRLLPIPLLADINGHLNSNFHTFHSGGQDIVLSEEGTRLLPSRLMSNRFQTLSGLDSNAYFKQRCDAFVQGWLYFELLRAILGRLDHFNILHFTRPGDDDNTYVTTKHLPRYLEQWLNHELENPDGSVARLLHAQLVLDKARHYIFEFCSVLAPNNQPKWTIDDRVIVSIMILGETLSCALTKIQRKTKVNLRGWSDHDYSRQGWGYSEVVLGAFHQEPGWCLKTVAMLQGLMRNSTIGLLYALDMRPKVRFDMEHTRCTNTECKATYQGRSVELNKPKSFHCHDCKRNNCKEVETDLQDLVKTIDRGQIPLLQYQPGAGKIDVVGMDASCNKDYVIFSHVWIDGFGNSKTNKMNECVLNMFCSTFTAVKGQNVISNRHGVVGTPENFWIDTLAIPVGENCSDQRRKAIRSMHEIYKSAKYTVVLDLGLMETLKGEGYIQPAMRITLSNWMTRLWTLQEAFLSKNLYFKFHDQVYSMDRLERLFQKEDEPLHSTLASLCRSYYHQILEKESRNMHGPDSAPEELVTAPSFVAMVWKAVQWRTTAHRQHETLALATLLHLDTDDFADPGGTVEMKEYDQIELNDRMQRLLDLLGARNPCAIPPGIIFVPGPRLRKQGYRWAPESWLSAHPVEPPDPVTIQMRTARLNVPHGLEVWYPGFRLHTMMNRDNLLTDLSTFHFTADRSLWQWYRALPVDKYVPSYPEAQKQSRDLAIIAPQLSASSAKEIGLLVEVTREQGSILFVEILHRIYISGESDPTVIRDLEAKFLGSDLRSMICGERLPSDQHWCVDGREDGETKEPERIKQRGQTMPGFRQRLTNLLVQ